MKRILIIDDESDVADLLVTNLRQRGKFTTSTAGDGSGGIQKAREESPALIVLDLMLPGISGLEVCRLLKADSSTKRIPVIMLTAKAGLTDRLRGFEIGAADYVTKPFSPREVVLRIEGIVGRYENPIDEAECFAGDISINRTRHEVFVGRKPVCLTAIEFKLLSYFMQTSGRTQSRDQLLHHVWDYSNLVTTRTVDNHVFRLRKKLGQAGDAIESVHSFGYRFRAPESRAPINAGRARGR